MSPKELTISIIQCRVLSCFERQPNHLLYSLCVWMFCLYVCLCACVPTDTKRGHHIPWKLLGINPRSSGGSIALNHWSISIAPILFMRRVSIMLEVLNIFIIYTTSMHPWKFKCFDKHVRKLGKDGESSKTQNAEAGKLLKVQGQPELHSEYQASQS